MRKKLLYFLITLFGATTLVSGYWWMKDSTQTIISSIDQIEQPTPQKEGIAVEETNITNKPVPNKKIISTTSTAEPNSAPVNTEINPEEIFEAKVTLQINGKNLQIPYQNNISAESVMKKAHARYPESFRYESIEYGGDLGTFVQSINGIAENNREKMYWILYINGKKSNKGISTLILNPDDIIMWNYEKEIL